MGQTRFTETPSYLMVKFDSIAPDPNFFVSSAPRAREQFIQRIGNRLPMFGQSANAFAELFDRDRGHVEWMQHDVDFLDAKNRIHTRACHCRLLWQCSASPKRHHYTSTVAVKQ